MAGLPGMMVILTVSVAILMRTARREDFGDESFGETITRVAKFPLKGPRRGGGVVRSGDYERIGGAARVHSDAGRLIVAFSAEVSGIDQPRPVGLQFGSETVFIGIEAIRMWLRR